MDTYVATTPQKEMFWDEDNAPLENPVFVLEGSAPRGVSVGNLIIRLIGFTLECDNATRCFMQLRIVSGEFNT